MIEITAKLKTLSGTFSWSLFLEEGNAFIDLLDDNTTFVNKQKNSVHRAPVGLVFTQNAVYLTSAQTYWSVEM